MASCDRAPPGSLRFGRFFRGGGLQPSLRRCPRRPAGDRARLSRLLATAPDAREAGWPPHRGVSCSCLDATSLIRKPRPAIAAANLGVNGRNARPYDREKRIRQFRFSIRPSSRAHVSDAWLAEDRAVSLEARTERDLVARDYALRRDPAGPPGFYHQHQHRAIVEVGAAPPRCDGAWREASSSHRSSRSPRSRFSRRGSTGLSI